MSLGTSDKKRAPFNVVLAGLLSKGYVEEDDDNVVLTAKGKIAANNVFDRLDDETLLLIYLESVGDYLSR